jgi:RNA polymerase sigma factor (sigma-70 family)
VWFFRRLNSASTERPSTSSPGRVGWLARLHRLAPDSSHPGLTVELEGQLALLLRRAARVRNRSPQALAQELLSSALEREALRRHAEAVLASLTPREREITWLAARGRTNQEIAEKLVISPETVKSHVRSVLSKFGLHSKSDLRMLLLDLGLRWWRQEAG